MHRPLQPRWYLPWRSQSTQSQHPDKNHLFSRSEQLLTQIKNEYNFVDFSIPSFCRWASQKRQRPIAMLPRKLAPGVYGVWLRFGDEDLIFYDKQASGIYLTHIQLHELAHILCGHRTTDLLQASSLGYYSSLIDWLTGQSTFLPVEADRHISQILLRTHHCREGADELEAETLTELIMTEIFGIELSAQMVVAPSYTQNRIIHEVFYDLGWL